MQLSSGMASAPAGLLDESDLIKEACCLPSSYPKLNMGPCSLHPPLSLDNKRRKLDIAPAPPATTCNCFSNQVEDESEDEADQRLGSLSMAIGERLSTLQHLLPQGLELEEEEVLKVALEYVKELERKIQMFHSTTEGCAKLDQSMNDSPLQKRGLCIVPLSILAKAL